MFLEQCKYVAKKEKMPNCIPDDIEISSDDSKVLMKKISYRMFNFYIFHVSNEKELLYLKCFELFEMIHKILV